MLIDSLLPNIIAEVLRTFFTSSLSSTKDLTEHIDRNNPIHYDTQFAHSFYEYKMKRFLTDVALGMTPSKVWTGIYDATGGYLVVKENGDVLCYSLSGDKTTIPSVGFLWLPLAGRSRNRPTRCYNLSPEREYHIYNRNQFEDYLFANTKLETASSTRHEFGKIYEDKEKFYFKLNLQIRFK